MSEFDWIDLPNDNYLKVLGYKTPNTTTLDLLIRKYNQIPKDQVVTLSCRIVKLDKIIDLIKDWTDNRLESIDKKNILFGSLK